jgi:hypothetical protein
MATRKELTRWTILDKACRAVDPESKIPVSKRAREEAEMRLAVLSPEAFDAKLADDVAFLARMRAKTLEMRAAFYALAEAHKAPEYVATSIGMHDVEYAATRANKIEAYLFERSQRAIRAERRAKEAADKAERSLRIRRMVAGPYGIAEDCHA